VTGAGSERHVSADEVVAYLDGAISQEERGRIQAHLAACADCRAEVRDVRAVVRALPGVRPVRRPFWIPAAAAAAAAAVVLVWLRPPSARTAIGDEHRNGSVTTTVAPRQVAPAGAVAAVDKLVWSSAPGADAYRVRLFDANGTVLWEEQTIDTVAPLPASIALRASTSYYWKVEARTGFDRWAASDLIEFVVAHSRSAR
jgi:hypothetical protein